jgi:hypothetical protein
MSVSWEIWEAKITPALIPFCSISWIVWKRLIPTKDQKIFQQVAPAGHPKEMSRDTICPSVINLQGLIKANRCTSQERSRSVNILGAAQTDRSAILIMKDSETLLKWTLNARLAKLWQNKFSPKKSTSRAIPGLMSLTRQIFCLSLIDTLWRI